MLNAELNLLQGACNALRMRHTCKPSTVTLRRMRRGLIKGVNLARISLKQSIKISCQNTYCTFTGGIHLETRYHQSTLNVHAYGLKRILPSHTKFNVFANLPTHSMVNNQPSTIPPEILITNVELYIVITDDQSITLVELTILYSTEILLNAKTQKESYQFVSHIWNLEVTLLRLSLSKWEH